MTWTVACLSPLAVVRGQLPEVDGGSRINHHTSPLFRCLPLPNAFHDERPRAIHFFFSAPFQVPTEKEILA
jgi:hypothetical protein